MQPLRRLMQSLSQLASDEHCLFTLNDLKVILPESNTAAVKTLLSRAVKEGVLARFCRGLYLFNTARHNNGLLLFYAAAKLRSHEFNYLSLETVLSDAGVISQMPINRIFVMSSGRSNIISCGSWGAIEFVHTRQSAGQLLGQVHYDAQCRMWRASVPQALRDMRMTRRSTDLVDWEVANEFV